MIKEAEVTPLRPTTSWQVAPTEYVPATARPAPKWRNIDQLEEMTRRAFSHGCCKQIAKPWRPGDTEFRRAFEIRYDGNCENPCVFDMVANHHADATVGRMIAVELWTRCRKCSTCRGTKSMYWAKRAVDEFNSHPATYMVTLTLRPEMHYFFDAKMHSSAPELGLRLSDMEKAGEYGLASATLFRARAQSVGQEVQKYLKRLRKGCGTHPEPRFRYLQVAEAHQKGDSPVSGRPHFHLLLHEVELGTLIKDTEYLRLRGTCTRCNRWHDNDFELCDHAFVRSQWPHGYTKVVRCVDHKSAFYLCKYMSKAMEVRVRASLDYGDWSPGLAKTRDGIESRERVAAPVGKLTPPSLAEENSLERSERPEARLAVPRASDSMRSGMR